MKLKKVIISYEILMPVDDDIGDRNLADVHMECMEGEWSGHDLKVASEEILEGEDACRTACAAHGTDLAFFGEVDDDDPDAPQEPAKPCKECSGTGEVEGMGSRADCAACGGTGEEQI